MHGCFNLALYLTFLGITLFAGTELFVRTFPRSIPIYVLDQFEPVLRSKVAKARNPPTKEEDTIRIPRNDHVPPDLLRVYKPQTVISLPFQDHGTVKRVTMVSLEFYADALHEFLALAKKESFQPIVAYTADAPIVHFKNKESDETTITA